MEETLKEIMGNDYKEGMSKDDIQAFFKKQVLSTGDYVNKGKASATENDLKNTIASLQAELDSKMTDDDKKKKESDDARKLIEKLQKELSESKANTNKMSAISNLAKAKISAGIQDGDVDFDDFVSSISFEDAEKTNKISNYVSKIVESAYEAGKSAATKNKLGKMGSFKDGDGSDNEQEPGSFGRKLAQLGKTENKNVKNFFERK